MLDDVFLTKVKGQAIDRYYDRALVIPDTPASHLSKVSHWSVDVFDWLCGHYCRDRRHNHCRGTAEVGNLYNLLQLLLVDHPYVFVDGALCDSGRHEPVLVQGGRKLAGSSQGGRGNGKCREARRIEVRFPDPTANPYLAFTAMLMAGIDGIKNKIHPGDSMDKDLYDLPPEEAAEIPTVASSLEMALEALDNDRDFLKAGGVMTDDMIDAYIDLKSEEVTKLNMTTHPVEFDMYYSV